MSNTTQHNNNNYLDLVVSELKNFPENNSEILNLIQSKKNVFNRFKREFSNNINNIKSKRLKAFALLAASRNNDDEFLDIITKKFDYDLLNNELAIFAKGIYYLYKNYDSKAIDLLWKTFQNNANYFTKNDFINLLKLLSYFYLNTKKEQLLNYLLNKFPNEIEFHCQKFLLFVTDKNKEIYENFFNDFEITNKHTKLFYKYHLLAEYYYRLGKLKYFYYYYEQAALNLDFEIDNNSYKNIKKCNYDFDYTKCFEDLDKLLDILEKNGYKPFLDGGTLLGLYRDGKLMDYDKDADIGLIVNYETNVEIEKYANKLTNVINNNGKYNCRIDFDANRKVSTVRVATNNDIAIDIFFYYKDYLKLGNNKLYSVCAGEYTLIPLLWEYDNFDLIKMKLANREYYVPNDVNKYLSQLYGNNWQEHIKIWWSGISCQNISKKSKLTVLHGGIYGLFNRIFNKEPYEYLNYFYEELKRWKYPFSPEMKNSIENYLSQIK